MRAPDLTARLDAIGAYLAGHAPAVLVALVAFFEALLATDDRRLQIERTPTAPITLTAEQVLEAARVCGVPAFGTEDGAQWILLVSLGLDLTDPKIRTALVDLYQRGELRLVRIDDPRAARADLAARGLRADLVEASALALGDTTFHAVAIP